MGAAHPGTADHAAGTLEDVAVVHGAIGERGAAELAKITASVLALGGANSPAWFHRSVAEQATIPGARLQLLDRFDHNAPP